MNARLTPPARALAEPLPLEARKIPDNFSERQRREFLEIASRAKVELNATFSLVAIGLQLYLETNRLAVEAREGQ